jgi:hypothetical protein
MPWELTCRCSRCGQRSNGGGTNGWFSVVCAGDSIAISPVSEKTDEPHFCGVACTLSAVGDTLRTGPFSACAARN